MSSHFRCCCCFVVVVIVVIVVVFIRTKFTPSVCLRAQFCFRNSATLYIIDGYMSKRERDREAV